ncbi:MAG: restriction endonuclease subunit S, partial [archaeon]
NSVWFAKMQATLKVYPFTINNKSEIEKYILSTGFAGVKLNENISPDYVKFYFISRSFNEEKDKLCTGSTQVGINNSFIAKMKIKIPFSNGKPDLKEQERIVSILEKAEKVKAKGENSEKLLDEYLNSVFNEMFYNKRFENVVLKKVCDKITDGTHFSPPNFEKGDFPYITAKNIKKDGIDLTNLTYIDKNSHKNIFQRCNPEIGDVLYIKDGATTGIAVVNNLLFEFSLLSSVALLKPNKKMLLGEYLVAALNSPAVYQIIRKDMGGAAITRLTLTKIEKIKIPLPPLPIQQKFAKIVEHVEGLKENVKKTKQNSEELFNSLMSKAFKGEL